MIDQGAERSASDERRPRKSGERFFLVMGGILLLLTVVGFTPTFYLRSLFDGPPLPPVLVVHGALSSIWILAFMVQVSLVSGSRIGFHRRLGPVVGIIAAAMLISGLFLLNSVVHSAENVSAQYSSIGPLVWGNLAILFVFAAFVMLGLWYRKESDTHKRFMLLATVSMMGQPIVRIGQIEVIRISDVRVINDAIYGLVGLAVLLVVIAAYDLVTRGRPHRVVAIGGPALVAGIVCTGLIIPGSEMGRSLILWWAGL